MVLDLRMPGMGGMEVLRETRKTHPGIQVIMLTGHGSTGHQDEAMRLGAFDYLQKPVHIDLLMSKITKASERSIC
jgi:DNA-binding NtrC family response regulator